MIGDAAEIEVAWLAGLLEGEGCFNLMRANSRSKRPLIRVQVAMTDRDIVERVRALMDAPSVQEHKDRGQPDNWKRRYVTCASGRKAEAVMRAVRPYMGERRGTKIDELLSTPDLSHHPKRS